MYSISRGWLSQPRNLFLVDGLGALLSAAMLLAMSGPLHAYVGMPQRTLIVLAIVAALFCMYSLTCYVALKNRWKPFLRGIAIMNLLYCLATIGCVIRHCPVLKKPGIMYFIMEILVIFSLVFVELSVAGLHGRKDQTA